MEEEPALFVHPHLILPFLFLLVVITGGMIKIPCHGFSERAKQNQPRQKHPLEQPTGNLAIRIQRRLESARPRRGQVDLEMGCMWEMGLDGILDVA